MKVSDKLIVAAIVLAATSVLVVITGAVSGNHPLLAVGGSLALFALACVSESVVYKSRDE